MSPWSRIDSKDVEAIMDWYFVILREWNGKKGVQFPATSALANATANASLGSFTYEFYVELNKLGRASGLTFDAYAIENGLYTPVENLKVATVSRRGNRGVVAVSLVEDNRIAVFSDSTSNSPRS